MLTHYSLVFLPHELRFRLPILIVPLIWIGMFSSPQRSRISSYRNTKAEYRCAHIEIFTKERPLPNNVRNVQPKGFIAYQSKVKVSV